MTSEWLDRLWAALPGSCPLCRGHVREGNNLAAGVRLESEEDRLVAYCGEIGGDGPCGAELARVTFHVEQPGDGGTR